jgi:hypothetical protein
MSTVGLAPDANDDPKNRLYECNHKFCKKHYLTELGITRHFEIEHGGKGTWTKVPIAAGEFD